MCSVRIDDKTMICYKVYRSSCNRGGKSLDVFFLKNAKQMIYVCESYRLHSLWELYAVFPALEVNGAGN